MKIPASATRKDVLPSGGLLLAGETTMRISTERVLLSPARTTAPRQTIRASGPALGARRTQRATRSVDILIVVSPASRDRPRVNTSFRVALAEFSFS